MNKLTGEKRDGKESPAMNNGKGEKEVPKDATESRRPWTPRTAKSAKEKENRPLTTGMSGRRLPKDATESHT